MNKALSLVFLLFLLTLSACSNSYTSKTSELQIVEKIYSNDYKDAWIIAFDPNNQTKNKKMKIMIAEPMVWNLIEVDKIYFASYSKKSDTHWNLEQIEHENDNNTLR